MGEKSVRTALFKKTYVFIQEKTAILDVYRGFWGSKETKKHVNLVMTAVFRPKTYIFRLKHVQKNSEIRVIRG